MKRTSRRQKGMKPSRQRIKQMSHYGVKCQITIMLAQTMLKISNRQMKSMAFNQIPASHNFCRLLSHLPIFFESLYCKQYGPRLDFSQV